MSNIEVSRFHEEMQKVGLHMKKAKTNQEGEEEEFVFAPITTSPDPLTVTSFHSLLRVMPVFNSMIDRIARDSEYLFSQVGPTDKLSSALAGILKKVYMTPGEKYQPLMLGLFRSDYLFDSEYEAELNKKEHAEQKDAVEDAFQDCAIPLNPGWKQVEINTIASSFPALSTRTGQAHTKLFPEKNIAVSTAERDVVSALERAHRHFVQCYPYEEIVSTPSSSSSSENNNKKNKKKEHCVCFLVQPGELNVGDQGLLRKGLEQLGVRVVRKSVLDLAKELSLDPKSQHAILRTKSSEEGKVATSTKSQQNEKEKEEQEQEKEESEEEEILPVSVFYYRSLYDWQEYEKHAEALPVRFLVEKSMAIKCPSVPYHLCTWKTIQKQLFTDESILKKFVPNPSEQIVMKSFMVPHYSLSGCLSSDSSSSSSSSSSRSILELVKDAIKNPHRWVVKTLREGYGFILEGEKMKEQLVKLVEYNEKEKKKQNNKEGEEENELALLREFAESHLLVYRIRAPGRSGGILKNGVAKAHSDLEPEMGTYGAILSAGQSKNVFFNLEAGYLLRTKSKSNLGGGVMSGVSALDTVELLPH